MSSQKILNIIFIIQLIFFGLIITGILPREVALYLGAALVIYFLVVPLDDSLVFFVRSIPLFLAMPLTADFDNFNVWRILAVIIFLKWIAAKFSIFNFQFSIKSQFSKLKNLLKPSISPSFFLIILLCLAVLSLVNAVDLTAGIKRIIYFLNFSIL